MKGREIKFLIFSSRKKKLQMRMWKKIKNKHSMKTMKDYVFSAKNQNVLSFVQVYVVGPFTENVSFYAKKTVIRSPNTINLMKFRLI